MIRIWGTAFSLIGDLIMSLPQLNYFKNKYNNIYVHFVIHKKISYCAPLFFNHPLIDKIHISGEWSSFNDHDYSLASSCDIITTNIDHDKKLIMDRKHQDKYWYNSRSCVEESAIMSGINNLNKFLNKNEEFPKLYKWFDEGFEEIQKKGAYNYNKNQSKNLNFKFSKSISIWPFAGYARSKNRNPDTKWWSKFVEKLTNEKINVYHFGYFKEPFLSSKNNFYYNFTNLDFFSQIKISLGTKLSLGTDSGSMWVLSAYSHPTLVLLTNWYDNHKKNFNAALPPNKNGDYIFKENNFSDLSIDEVYEKCIQKGITKINKFDEVKNYFS